MAVIDLLTEVGDGTGESVTEIRSGNPFLDADGRLSRAAFVEMAGQTAAAIDTFNNNRVVRPGMISSIRSFAFHGDARVHDRLTVQVTRMSELGPWVLIGAQVREGNRLVAEGELRVCLHGV
jgi:predicted hotdog family 3-hydroxylacyl-ACP dehydratase